MLNAAQYAALSNDMLSNNDDNTNPYWADPSLLGTGTNWLDEMLRTGVKQSYSVSYSGGTERHITMYPAVSSTSPVSWKALITVVSISRQIVMPRSING